jgi:hypothetical protein
MELSKKNNNVRIGEVINKIFGHHDLKLELPIDSDLEPKQLIPKKDCDFGKLMISKAEEYF